MAAKGAGELISGLCEKTQGNVRNTHGGSGRVVRELFVEGVPLVKKSFEEQRGSTTLPFSLIEGSRSG